LRIRVLPAVESQSHIASNNWNFQPVRTRPAITSFAAVVEPAAEAPLVHFFHKGVCRKEIFPAIRDLGQ
jgi:hypothetical protein